MTSAKRAIIEIPEIQPEELIEQQPLRKENVIAFPRQKPKPLPETVNLPLARSIILFICAFVLAGFISSTRSAYLYSISQAIEAEQSEITTMQNQNEMLRIKIYQASSLETIEQRAIGLGFHKPGMDQYLKLPGLSVNQSD
ncbi:MAG: hypothetical protein LLG09_01645 [Negativicutes bacterium]|nr:hypothetical protein [Negativicutes bacterium]